MTDFIFTDVDSILIENASKSICDRIEELSSISAVFKCDVMTCLNPCWCGLAKQRFEQQFLTFAELFEKLVDSYKDLNERLKCSGASYNRSDDLVRQYI